MSVVTWESGNVMAPSPAQLMQAADAERRRIARELHDGLQTRLIRLAMRADRVRGEAGLSPEGRAEAGWLHAELCESISELRGFVHGVMPAALAERGLVAAITELTDELPAPVDLTVGQRESDLQLIGRLPAEVQTAAYFVVSEAVANAIKHSHADQVQIAVRSRPGWLRIEISDDGIGGAITTGGGMRGMVDRVRPLAGRLTVSSPVGAGTQVTVELPCAS
jgi:signal transduction histidine kinase